MTNLAQTSPELLDPILNQTQESYPVHQVNQTFMPQDFTPHVDKLSEFVPPSFHLSQFDEFESDDHVEKELEDEIVYEVKTFLQLLCEPVINPIFEKCIIHESPNDQYFDIFNDDDCIYLDNLFEDNVEMHTTSCDNADKNCDEACMDNELLLDKNLRMISIILVKRQVLRSMSLYLSMLRKL